MSKKPRIIDVDFPAVAKFLNVTSGYIGKLHYIKKSKKSNFLALLEQSDFTVYKIREQLRQPWLAIHFATDEDLNLFRLMFGNRIHQCYVIKPEDKPAGTFISANKYLK